MNLTGIIEGIAQRGAASAVHNENDYIGADGLWYCGICNKRKQTRITIADKVMTVPVMCGCEEEAKKAQEAEERRKAIKAQRSRMRVIGFPDEEMREWTFAADDGKNEQLSRVAHNYVDNFGEMRTRGKGLLLWGDVGVGKSFMSACIANALIDHGVPCLVTNMTRIINTISADIDNRQNILDGLQDYCLLVLDDLGSERDTDYTGEIVHSIIEQRYRSGKPLIVTTNFAPGALQGGTIRRKRVFSRLTEMCVPYHVEGADRRYQCALRENEELKEMLGIV